MGAEVDRDQMAAAWRALGLNAGDSVVVHSSFKSLGPVAGGPLAVVGSLLDAIGPDGYLVLPTFNYTGPPSGAAWDVSTPCRTGIIPELGRRHPAAVRSLHPSHSVAAIGPQAEALVRDHIELPAAGIGSPLDRLAKLDGKVLLLGVDHRSNSMIHVGEEYAGVPKSRPERRAPRLKLRLPDDSEHTVEIDSSPSCSLGFGPFEAALEEHGELVRGSVGQAAAQLVRARDVIRRVGCLLATTPRALLCDREQCGSCDAVRRNLAAGGGQEEARTPLPRSPGRSRLS